MNINRERLSSAKKSQHSHHCSKQSHADIDAIHAVVETGQHRPGRRLEQVLERRRAGLPDLIPDDIKDPVMRTRYAAAQQRCNARIAAANKGV